MTEGRCGVVVSRNVVVTQVRSDPGSIPGISTQFLSSRPKPSVQSSLNEMLVYNTLIFTPINCGVLVLDKGDKFYDA